MTRNNFTDCNNIKSLLVILLCVLVARNDSILVPQICVTSLIFVNRGEFCDLQRTPQRLACGTVRMCPPRVLHKQLECGQSPKTAKHKRRRSIKDGDGAAKFLKSNKMPKRLVSEGWVKKPCLYHLPAGAARVCTWCQEPFSFWNGRHHCAFCGYVFHRSECTRKCSIEGEFFKRRICVYCDQYRAYEAKLRTGKLSLLIYLF